MNKLKDYIKLMRVNHYLKNFLIFLPIVFSCQIFNVSKFFICIIGFISFSLLASAIYCINDIKDVEKDKAHPVKKNRPIASGRISRKEAIIFAIILIVLSFLLNILIFFITKDLKSIVISVGIEFLYLILNIFYSFGLKNVPIVDVVILVSGFIIRVFYGAEITGIYVSNWIYLTVMMGSFYMGFGKRRNEVIKQGEKSREVLKKYNQDFLDKFMYISLVLTIVFYSLWCIDGDTIARIGNEYIVWTIPLAFIILMKYSLDVEGNSFGAPVDVILKDKGLIALVLLAAITIMLILYVL